MEPSCENDVHWCQNCLTITLGCVQWWQQQQQQNVRQPFQILIRFWSHTLALHQPPPASTIYPWNKKAPLRLCQGIPVVIVNTEIWNNWLYLDQREPNYSFFHSFHRGHSSLTLPARQLEPGEINARRSCSGVVCSIVWWKWPVRWPDAGPGQSTHSVGQSLHWCSYIILQCQQLKSVTSQMSNYTCSLLVCFKTLC